jgi:hypothetical protein
MICPYLYIILLSMLNELVFDKLSLSFLFPVFLSRLLTVFFKENVSYACVCVSGSSVSS